MTLSGVGADGGLLFWMKRARLLCYLVLCVSRAVLSGLLGKPGGGVPAVTALGSSACNTGSYYQYHVQHRGSCTGWQACWLSSCTDEMVLFHVAASPSDCFVNPFAVINKHEKRLHAVPLARPAAD